MRNDFNGKKVCDNTLNTRNPTAKNFVPYMFVDCVDLSVDGAISFEFEYKFMCESELECSQRL